MPIDHVAEDGKRSHGINEHPVAQHWSAHVGDQNMGNNAHTGYDRDVNLGMPEEPEQMLPQKSGSARVWLQLVVNHQVRCDKETSSSDVIENQQDADRKSTR